jgi:hypothetical protein
MQKYLIFDISKLLHILHTYNYNIVISSLHHGIIFLSPRPYLPNNTDNRPGIYDAFFPAPQVCP